MLQYLSHDYLKRINVFVEYLFNYVFKANYVIYAINKHMYVQMT